MFLSKETSIPSGSKFPQTTMIYVCSNAACQKEKDVQTAKRIKLQKDKEDIALQKIEAKKKNTRDIGDKSPSTS